HGEALTIDIGRKSPLWPTGADADIGTFVTSFKLDIFIRKNPLPAEQFVPMIATDGNYADWLATALIPNKSDRNHLTFDRRDGRFVIFGITTFDRRFQQSNGKVASILDLYGAQLFLVPPQHEVQLPAEYKKYQRPQLAELNRIVTLKTVHLRFSEGR